MLLQLICVLVCLFVYWKTYTSRRPRLESPPDVSYKFPVIGHAHLFIGDSQKAWKTLQMISTETLKKGGVTILSIGPIKGYVITDPEDIAIAANACVMKNYYYSFAKQWLGDGFLTGGEKWRKFRKMMMPLFSQHVLNGFIGILNNQGRNLVNKWKDRKGPFNHSRDVSLNNLESICQNALGIKLDEEKLLNEEYENAIENILYIITARFKKVWLHLDFMYKWSYLKKMEDRAVEILHNMSNTALRKRKQEWSEIQDKERDNNIDSNKYFLDIIFDGKAVYNDTELREAIDNLIFAGHDTISTAVVFCLVVLGSYNEVQEKVYEELQNVFNNTDRDLEKDDYSKLVYLEAVIKETLRVYPIVPIIARYVNNDVKLKNYTMEAGSNCFITFSGSHLHPSWGPDVAEFKPERWLNPATLPSNPNVFGGFSLGRRACIGKNYAIMSLKTTLAHVLRYFKVKSDISKMVLKVDVMLKPASGHEITLKRRVRT